MSKSTSGFLSSNPTCPKCKISLGAYGSEVEGAVPESGDMTICCYCMSVLQFTDTMELKFAPDEMIEEHILEISQGQHLARQFNEFKSLFDLED